MDTKVKCPSCGTKFELSDAVESKIRSELGDEFAEKEAEYRRQLKSQASDLADKAKADRDRAVAEALKLAEDDHKVASDSMVAQLQATRAKLQVAQSAEVELRKKAQELEDAKAELDLEVSRRIDAERSRIREEVSSSMAEQHAGRQQEWEHQRQSMERLIEDLKRKAEQGSQQTQGESFEADFEESLRAAFPNDEVVPVEKGVKGADVVHHVRTPTGVVGTIVWELKRTKNWSAAWTQKVKDDARAAKADAAVIVTQAMPESVKRVGFVDGVLVADTVSYLGVAAVLRSNLIGIAKVRSANDGRKSKADALFSYITGNEFKGRVETVIEAFVELQESLASERRSFEKIWASREKQIARAIGGMAGMYGDMSGHTGELAEIQLLRLEKAA